ncbi:MAG: N-acetylglucosamine-6-phosphate deacetylase [Zavarzinella sp.]
MKTSFVGARIILPDVVKTGTLTIENDRIVAISDDSPADHQTVDLTGHYLLPGFVDLHVHGGRNADFMDGTETAFATVLQAHLEHGTTSMTPTSTVADHEEIMNFLRLTRQFRAESPACRVLGAHFYGPYFAPPAKGCHPGGALRPPTTPEYEKYLTFADIMTSATVAPELPGAKEFALACRERGVRVNIGHSHATFDQVQEAISWGATHVDHLFCAMSDRARLRLSQAFPMRGGVMEATLFFDELTTEVIADGKHLAPELLKLAWKCKGADRLALVTDTMRAMDMPDGEYIFGNTTNGEVVRKHAGVGVTLDGSALASSVQGMDHMFRTMLQALPDHLPEVTRMATLTPATIAGVGDQLGSLEVGKIADLVVMSDDFHVQQVYLAGKRMV